MNLPHDVLSSAQIVAMDIGVDTVQPLTGWTALHHAVYCNRVKNCKLLLSCGADLEARDRRGVTPERIARDLGRDEILTLFQHSKERGAQKESREIDDFIEWRKLCEHTEKLLRQEMKLEQLAGRGPIDGNK